MAEHAGAEREAGYLRALRRFYHPVAAVEELERVGRDEHDMLRVLGKELLGELIVLARLDGRVVALHGTCSHRGAGLHIGWHNAAAATVVCRYHGFEWDAVGDIHRIPAVEAEGHELPAGRQWRVRSYPTDVKYGLIWVSLDQEPAFPVIEVAEAQDSKFVASPIFRTEWAAGCGRIVEASLDTYHFAFTHWGSIGTPERPEAPKAATTVTPKGFRVQYSIHQPKNRTVTYDASDAAPGTAADTAFVTSDYRFSALPNAVHMSKNSGNVRFGALVAITPVGPQRSLVYRRLFTHSDWAIDLDEFYAVQTRVNEEDRYVVESQRPWELMTDLDAELQAYMDRPTVACRRCLGSLGIESP